MVGLLKGSASRSLEVEGLHPLREYSREDGSLPSPWASKCWKVYLDSEDDVRRAIRYVDDNPEGEGLPRQHWNFISPFEPFEPFGW